MSTKWIYSLTVNEGKTLFESLEPKHFDKIVEEQAEIYKSRAIPDDNWRCFFVDEKLWDMLNGDNLDFCQKKFGDEGEGDSEGWIFYDVDGYEYVRIRNVQYYDDEGDGDEIYIRAEKN